MNSGNTPLGFTIIEILIVLALGSFLFIAAAATMGGDQKQTEFDTGARLIYSELQSLSSDVQNGNYGSDNYQCQISSGIPTFDNNTPRPGSNFGCTYVGKAIQFFQTSSYYYVYNLVGDQYASSTDFNTPPAFPNSATVMNSGFTSDTPVGTQIINLPDQFRVSKITYGNLDSTNYIVGYYNYETSDLSSSSSLGNSLFVMPINNPLTPIGAISLLNKDNTPPPGSSGDNGDYIINPASQLKVCFTSPVEPNQWIDVSFTNKSDSTNLTLNYVYNSSSC